MADERHVEAWRRLCVKQGVGLGALMGSRGDEFAAALAAASLALPAGVVSTEREVNERLRLWLSGAGAMLATDHVELRRWLVDLGFVERDGYGRAYVRTSPPPAAYAGAVASLAAIDPAAVAHETREALARDRALRRAKHEAATGGRA